MVDQNQAPGQGQQVARVPRPTTMEGWLTLAGPAITRALPQVGIAGDRYLQLVLSAVKNSANLMKCTPVSVAVAAVQAAATGLVPNTPLGHASLIPRKGVAVFQIEYKGWLQMLYRTNEIESVGWSIVYQNERFKYSPAAREKLTHEVIDDEEKRGPRRGAYFSAWFQRGGQYAHWMPMREILTIRDRYSDGWRAFKAGKISDSPWNPANPQAEGWMILKTVIIQAVKRAPVTTELGQIVAAAAARQELQDSGKVRQMAGEFFDAIDLDDLSDDELGVPYSEPTEAPAAGASDAGAELAEFQAAVSEWPRDSRGKWEAAHKGKAPCVGPGCKVCSWPAQPPHAFEPAKAGGKSCRHDGMGPLWHKQFTPTGRP